MGILRTKSKVGRNATPLAADALPQRGASGANVPAQRPLFRQEVLDFQRHNRQWGRVVPLQPMSIRLMVWSIIAATAVVIVFLFFAQYARKETVAGYLTPSSGTAKVFAARPGTVSAVYVEQGQKVDAGQRLLTVATGEVDAQRRGRQRRNPQHPGAAKAVPHPPDCPRGAAHGIRTASA